MLTDGIQSTESHSSAMTHPSALFPGDNHIKGNHRERHSTRRCMDAGRRERERKKYYVNTSKCYYIINSNAMTHRRLLFHCVISLQQLIGHYMCFVNNKHKDILLELSMTTKARRQGCALRLPCRQAVEV